MKPNAMHQNVEAMRMENANKRKFILFFAVVLSVTWFGGPLLIGLRPFSWNAATSQCLFLILFVSVLALLWSPKRQVGKVHLICLITFGLIAQFISVETTAALQKTGSGGHGLACGGISTVLAVVLAVGLASLMRKVTARFGPKSYLALGLIVIVGTSSVNLYCPVSTYKHATGHATGYLLAVLLLYLISAIPSEFENRPTPGNKEEKF